MNYKNFNLNINSDIKTINYNGYNINVKQYLPIKDKYDLISIVLQNSLEDGAYNVLKIDMYLRLYTVFMYTDIEFDDKDRADEPELYDALESNGIIEAVISAIGENEWVYNVNTLETIARSKASRNNTLAYTINNLINNLPVNAKDALAIVNKFNPEDFQKVMDFARAVNNGNNPK